MHKTLILAGVLLFLSAGCTGQNTSSPTVQPTETTESTYTTQAPTTTLPPLTSSPNIKRRPLGAVFGVEGIIRKKAACENNPDPVFTSDITDIEKISLIVPPGTLEGTVLKTHSYVQVVERAPVYAPHEAYLYEGVFYTEEGMTQYSLFFRVTCEVMFIFDHIQEPVEKIKESFPDIPAEDTRTEPLRTPIFFKEGELIGHTTGTKFAKHFDFGVYNSARPNFLVSQDEHNVSQRDTTANCPYDYFPEEKRDIYYSLFGSFISDAAPTTFCNSNA